MRCPRGRRPANRQPDAALSDRRFGRRLQVSAEPADFPVYEGTGDDDRLFWWRFPTGTKAIADDQEQQRIIRRRFGSGNA